MTEETKRAPRVEEQAPPVRRRRQGALDHGARIKMAVPEDQLDRANFEYRWINDDGSRLQQLTQNDDWDVVSGQAPEGAGAESSRIRYPVDKGPDGEPRYAYLCRKPREYVEEDRKAKDAVLREHERALLRKKKTSAQDDRSDETAYVPPGNTISTGYQP